MRKHYSASFKAQVVLELLREEKTVTQLASEYGVHPTMLHRWKNTVVDNLSSLFEDVDKKNTTAIKREHEKELEELYSKIGRLTTQVEWLKKIWPQPGLVKSVWRWSSGTIPKFR
ncbi:Transposase [Alicyclobacillus macrosporangiidus]|uniref:Transposase n=1 Tax=Alicyclobacillus macrosporangiidus TaxID=392015 RepID=A0A1I7LE16_9BACL|nr:Transposase [Alicyclobacillus macrosporangiidus]